MTQSSVIIDPNTVDGSGLATILNNFRSSLLSGHSGSSMPSYATGWDVLLEHFRNPVAV